MSNKSAMYLKSEEEIECIRRSSLIVSDTLAEIAKILKPGMNGLELDAFAEEYIKSRGAVPSFKNYRGFPYSLCISVNDAVVHGFPNNRAYKDGDIISVDCGAFFEGFHGDSAYTFAMGNVKPSTIKLLSTTKKSLELGISRAIVGNRTGDIAFEIQNVCESAGYSVVRERVGHGLGRNLHEEPDVPNYGKKGKGVILRENLVLAIEPMINEGTKNIVVASDDWTILTKDGKMSAHFEHTIVVKKDTAIKLTSFEQIEAAIAKNPALMVVND
ncbi:MAG: type I methionyl aminopeptidase [Bacteroidetes bacterium]|nr:type I methionyl aminopeptidase [Bacteroidota bacterium]